MNRSIRLCLASLALAIAAAPAVAQVSVRDAWLRATVPAQTAAGAFMQLTSAADARLLEASSPAARAVEIHEMAMDGNVMRMRQIAGLDLPAGKPVMLRPGGYHLMLIDLKAQLKDGDTVPFTLVVQGRDGRRETVELKAQVRPINAMGPAGGHSGHAGHAGHAGHGKGN
jgi:copper(I)-binding protein